MSTPVADPGPRIVAIFWALTRSGPSQVLLSAGIIIRADTVLDDVEQLVDYLAIEVGEPYSLDAVSGSIRNLQASGRTGQIEAFARIDYPKASR